MDLNYCAKKEIRTCSSSPHMNKENDVHNLFDSSEVVAIRVLVQFWRNSSIVIVLSDPENLAHTRSQNS